MLYHFILTYEHEPDTSWTLRVQGTARASTLERAMVQAARSLGYRLGSVCGECRGDGWRYAVVPFGGGPAIHVHECPECGGSGCDECSERGFVWPEPAADPEPELGVLYCPNYSCEVRVIAAEDAKRSTAGELHCPSCGSLLGFPPSL